MVCLQSCQKVTDILSYRGKRADRIVQLNRNRESATPFFLAEDYANKLLPAGLCGMPPYPCPSLPGSAVGPVNLTGRPMTTMNVCMCLGTQEQNNHANCSFLPRISPGDLFLCHISNYGSDDTQTPKCCRFVGCQWVKGCTVGNNRRPPSLMAEYKRGLAIRGNRDGFIAFPVILTRRALRRAKPP